MILQRTYDQKRPKILLCAPSNGAIDEIVRRLLSDPDFIGKGQFPLNKCRASSIPIFSYFLTKFLFFREIPIFSYFLAILPLILVFYSFLSLFHVKIFLKIFSLPLLGIKILFAHIIPQSIGTTNIPLLL